MFGMSVNMGMPTGLGICVSMTLMSAITIATSYFYSPNPDTFTSTVGETMKTFVYITVSVDLLVAVDSLIRNLRPHLTDKARWFLMHCLVNAIVALWTLPYVRLVWQTPVDMLDANITASMGPSILIMSLHVYHSVLFRLNEGDVIHHTVMMLLLLIPLLSASTLYLLMSNYCSFFVNGLPGGIDYYLVYRVETGRMDILLEKRINKYLNTWIRSLGILFGVFYSYNAWAHGVPGVSGYAILAATAALTWNAQYFSSEVAQSYGKAKALREMEEKARISRS